MGPDAAGIPSGATRGTMNDFRIGHSRLHPVNTSCMFFPPVMTILPEKKHRRTTGEASGRYIRPGNIFRWYVQFSAILAYIACRSRLPPWIGISTCATMFCTSQACRKNEWPGMHSRSRVVMKRDAYTHSYHDLHPVTTSFPLENSKVVQSGLCRRTVMAANLCWS